MNTVKIENYTFDKVAKTITFNDFSLIKVEDVISITDVAEGVNVQIFYSKLPNYGGTVSGNVLTLNYDTNTERFNNSDKMLIEMVLDNYSATVVSSSAKTETGNSSDIINYGAKGAIFFVNVSAISGETPSMIVKLQMRDETSEQYKDIPGAVTAAITATGATMLAVYPGIAESANSKVSFPLPKRYRLVWTITGTTPSITFSVGASYIK